MRFVEIETIPSGTALVDLDKVTHAVPLEQGSRLHLGAEQLDVPLSLDQLGNLLAGRAHDDDGEHSRAGFSLG